MQRSRFHDWLAAFIPALVWLLFRCTEKILPLPAAVCMAWALPAGAVLLYCKKRGLNAFRLSGRNALLWTGIGITCGILALVCFGKPAALSFSVSSFILLCILGPAAEEIVYRGFVYESFLRFLPAAGAAVLNSLLFAVAHRNPAEMAAAFAAGVLFSFVRKKSGTITAPVILHIMVNAVVFLL